MTSRVNVTVDQETLDSLNHISDIIDALSVSEVIRRAIYFTEDLLNQKVKLDLNRFIGEPSSVKRNNFSISQQSVDRFSRISKLTGIRTRSKLIRACATVYGLACDHGMEHDVKSAALMLKSYEIENNSCKAE